MIRYADIIDSSVVDGLGIRVVTFLQGCPFRCEGCHNPQLQSFKGGIEIPEANFAEKLLSFITPLHKGITFSGGDPLMQADELNTVIKIIREQKPDLDIWVYTGFEFEEVKHLPVMRQIDVLVDGRFIEGQKDLNLPFRGSANQRIVDVVKSLKTGIPSLIQIAQVL